ncbi:hypothetical protein BLNAU_16167 [Blattamonas nauphoetae]|uniref:Uncharacterized protein n=1 Tax=Blattamonas nauphoetae TaxID=2049346 RepID=A0ABQ9XB80_9EUKA|nr:hypothetical protein BLNAU_16167 [Blattamonas nauphoetae]
MFSTDSDSEEERNRAQIAALAKKKQDEFSMKLIEELETIGAKEPDEAEDHTQSPIHNMQTEPSIPIQKDSTEVKFIQGGKTNLLDGIILTSRQRKLEYEESKAKLALQRIEEAGARQTDVRRYVTPAYRQKLIEQNIWKNVQKDDVIIIQPKQEESNKISADSTSNSETHQSKEDDQEPPRPSSTLLQMKLNLFGDIGEETLQSNLNKRKEEFVKRAEQRKTTPEEIEQAKQRYYARSGTDSTTTFKSAYR